MTPSRIAVKIPSPIHVRMQNSAIEKANTQLRQLARERDEAISQLNERTKAFNELVEKYNKLGNR